ncbi:hypothetical protein LTR29_011139 [Friedmanniomyces endolithicus]|nr:hypothetical protein LTR29_011139 [Friedmanniomyces endolithicus]
MAEDVLQLLAFGCGFDVLYIVLSEDEGRSRFKLTRTDRGIQVDLRRDSSSHDQLSVFDDNDLRFALDMLEQTRFLTVAAS